MATIEELGALFERIPVAMYRSAPGGRVLAANRAFAKLLGYESTDEMLGGVATVLNIYADPQRRTEWLETIDREGLVYDFDVELRRKDGSTVWVQDTARAVRDESGTVMYYEGALIDVTEKVKAKKARDEFLATISHELRNPLAVVLGLSEELTANYDSFSDDDRRDMANLIARQAEDASWIIEDLLVAYQDDAGKIIIASRPFDITKEAERVLEVVDYPIDVRVEGPDSKVLADPRRTRQILRNLVSNALRYGGELVTVYIRRAESEVTVKVCDSGREIDPASAGDIFKPFVRGKGEHASASVGLGLSVARTLADAMGGELTYRYEDSMSCFVLKLPAA